MAILSYKFTKTLPTLMGILSFREPPSASNANREGQNVVSSVVEDNSQYRICLMIPGFSSENFSISLDNEVITIEADKNGKSSKRGFLERLAGNNKPYFSRSFRIPGHELGNELQATYENGVFMLSVPKNKRAKVA